MEIFSLVIAALLFLYCSAHDQQCNVHVVLQGATGDLAKKYLWSAIFDNYVAQLQIGSGCKFVSVTASSREPQSKGDAILAALDDTLKCPDSVRSAEQCNVLKKQFSELVSYHRLKHEEDYELLAAKHQVLDESCDTCCNGKLFYLSVPPHAYSGIAKHIHTHLRPKSPGWIRVLFEKPFGSDLSSTVTLHNELGQYLQEEEIYRVDHYLSKEVIKQILPFRQRNMYQLHNYWNSEHISHIEMVIKEKVDCSGRTKFYDQYGIIRDVFQNHLTEMMALVAMDLLSANITGEDSSKVNFLKSLFPPRLYNAVLGQYDQYMSHLVSDGVKQNAENISHTPTYATVMLFSRAPQWFGVPFFLTSGKSLDRRSTYIRIVFKSNLISPEYLTNSSCNPEIVFLIQDDHYEVLGILVTEYFVNLLSIANIKGWKKDFIDANDFGCGPYAYLNAGRSSINNNAYFNVLLSALLGDKDRFVSIERLLLLWKIWSPLLEEIGLANPHIQLYSENTLELLHYKRIGSKLYFVQSSTGSEEPQPSFSRLSEVSSVMQSNLIVANKFALADKLTAKLKYLISQAAENSSIFHVALPGGTSPDLFYQNIVMQHSDFTTWDFIHIWQVDERCVPYHSLNSNLHSIDKKFLQLVPIPRSNIHPMVAHNGNCHNADVIYQTELSHYNVVLDLVVLGLGSDGHVASLFPNVHYNESEILISYVKLQESHTVDVRERITMTFKLILQAKHVAVLAVDDSKCDVVKILLNGGGAHLPATRLLHQPNVFWYINQNCVI